MKPICGYRIIEVSNSTAKGVNGWYIVESGSEENPELWRYERGGGAGEYGDWLTVIQDGVDGPWETEGDAIFQMVGKCIDSGLDCTENCIGCPAF